MLHQFDVVEEPQHEHPGEEEDSVLVKCFGCDALIAADDFDAVADAFVAHGKESHTWPYPEEAIRNYARNYAEATERLSGDTERRAEIGDITVHPVTKDRIDDWLRFFDHDAFAGNPDWASCYCLEPHLPATPEQPERPWRETRATVAERLRGGTTFGYLAYVDGRPAGWVNASMRSDYGLYRDIDPDGPEATSVIGVSCFVIAPPFRRHGIASTLLDRVIADAPARGAAWIEGYPRNKPEESDAGHFRGPRSIYDARGFEPIKVRERDTVVRLSAIPARLPLHDS
jgi:GNAT superfamily N-acetyltransferase